MGMEFDVRSSVCGVPLLLQHNHPLTFLTNYYYTHNEVRRTLHPPRILCYLLSNHDWYGLPCQGEGCSGCLHSCYYISNPWVKFQEGKHYYCWMVGPTDPSIIIVYFVIYLLGCVGTRAYFRLILPTLARSFLLGLRGIVRALTSVNIPFL